MEDVEMALSKCVCSIAKITPFTNHLKILEIRFQRLPRVKVFKNG